MTTNNYAQTTKLYKVPKTLSKKKNTQLYICTCLQVYDTSLLFKKSFSINPLPNMFLDWNNCPLSCSEEQKLLPSISTSNICMKYNLFNNNKNKKNITIVKPIQMSLFQKKITWLYGGCSFLELLEMTPGLVTTEIFLHC